MAYYAAVISLKQTIQRLLNSCLISILPPSREIIEFTCKELSLLQEVLNRLESNTGKRVNTLNGQIRDAVCKLEDTIESHVSNQFLVSQSAESLADDDHEGSSSLKLISQLDLEEVKKDINSFTEMVKKMEKMMLEELNNPMPEDEDGVVSSRVDHFDEKNSKMVGFSGEFVAIKQMVTTGWKRRDVISLMGMAGIGKTTLAMKIFEDPIILSQFEHRAFVTIGPKYHSKKVILAVLSQMNHDVDKIHMEGDGKLAEYLYTSLKGKRYLIVLDDVWTTKDLDELKSLLPDDYKGSRVLVTTRLEGVARSADQFKNLLLRVPFLDKKESWYLLCEKVFGEVYLCPPKLEKAGKKIAENCEGLPLQIITVADILSRAEKTPEYWKQVADKENSVFTDAAEKMSKVLFPSYKYLPQHLKACFLYMGVIPPSSNIPASKLIRLWSAEGFLEPDSEDFAIECLEELVSSSLVLACQHSSSFGTKTCSLHCAFHYLCIREAGKEKFLHVMDSYASSCTEGIKNQRRLCIHENTLFGIKEAHDSMESISTAHSLLCTGPHHRYPVPICFGLRLLRVLDTLTIRSYKFPIEVLELVQLRYLALTCSGNIPASISKLWNLQYLIVRRHLTIKSSEASSDLPMEIWDMQELRHLQVMGSNLINPYGTALLPNLLELSDISADSCSKEILERAPNLKKLGIKIELAPDASHPQPLFCFDHISHFHGLESLKCIVMNPKPMTTQVVAPLTCNTILPSSLKKLSFSGLGYPWKDMRPIAELPNLEVLKLRCYAFQGPEWVTNDWEFKRLAFLLLEDTDLVCLRDGGNYCFPFLRRLIIRHCYNLKEIPPSIKYVLDLEMFELDDCPSAVAYVNQMRESFAPERTVLPEVCVHSSWDDGNINS